MFMSTAYQDPTTKMVKDFLSLAEGSDNGIYYDAKNKGYKLEAKAVF